ncbi:MAG: hypothetical protein AAGC85_03880 [Bacteroidota bacterium]
MALYDLEIDPEFHDKLFNACENMVRYQESWGDALADLVFDELAFLAEKPFSYQLVYRNFRKAYIRLNKKVEFAIYYEIKETDGKVIVFDFQSTSLPPIH